MGTFKYRDASITDLKTIVAIYNSTVASRMVTADLEEVSVESKMPWFYDHEPETRPLWIVEDEKGSVIGWVSFQSFYGRPAYNGTAEISIYLAEARRGKGAGAEILKYSMKQAPKLGINTLLGYIFAHNEPSLKLFRNQGFTDWGVFKNIANMDGVERTLVIVGKRVA
ncbi:MAG: N-acetyltransferase [Bacteroidetes bacterium]|nr:N-acetyltransferase [Bacteroidota bacterium]